MLLAACLVRTRRSDLAFAVWFAALVVVHVSVALAGSPL
jgi:hypothetical protein